MGDVMRRIQWEKLPRPLRILFLPFAVLMAIVGWTMIVLGERQEAHDIVKKANRQVERATLCSQ